MDRAAPDLLRHRRALYSALARYPAVFTLGKADNSPRTELPVNRPTLNPRHDGPLDRAWVHARSGAPPAAWQGPMIEKSISTQIRNTAVLEAPAQCKTASSPSN